MCKSEYANKSQLARTLLKSGLSNFEILKNNPSISSQDLSHQRRILGLPMLKRGRPVGSVWESTRLRIEKVKILKSNGHSVFQISKMLGVSHQCLYQQLSPQKSYCHSAVQDSLKNGKIKRPKKCQNCSKIVFVEAHHPNYEHPLEIEWLCSKCHGLNQKVLTLIKRLNHCLSLYENYDLFINKNQIGINFKTSS